jgi:hypothetical protein
MQLHLAAAAAAERAAAAAPGTDATTVALSKEDALFYKALALLYRRTASAASSRSWWLLSEKDKGTRKKSLYRALAHWWPQQGVGLSKLTDEEHEVWDVLSNEEKGRWTCLRRSASAETTAERTASNVNRLLVQLATQAEASNTGDTAALNVLRDTLGVTLGGAQDAVTILDELDEKEEEKKALAGTVRNAENKAHAEEMRQRKRERTRQRQIDRDLGRNAERDAGRDAERALLKKRPRKSNPKYPE